MVDTLSSRLSGLYTPVPLLDIHSPSGRRPQLERRRHGCGTNILMDQQPLWSILPDQAVAIQVRPAAISLGDMGVLSTTAPARSQSHAVDAAAGPAFRMF